MEGQTEKQRKSSQTRIDANAITDTFICLTSANNNVVIKR